MIIVGKDCEKCIHGTIDDSSKSKTIIKCTARNKSYIWGQSIPCENKRVIKK